MPAFEPGSRYRDIEEATITIVGPDGTARQIAYLRRRFVPRASDGRAAATEHLVCEGERLDQITARYLGDPAQFHVLADDNGALHPDELTAEVGRVLRIPGPRF